MNGQPKVYTWATPLSAAAGKARSVKLTRILDGRPRVIPINAVDGNALRMPMLPGDVMQVD